MIWVITSWITYTVGMRGSFYWSVIERLTVEEVDNVQEESYTQTGDSQYLCQ